MVISSVVPVALLAGLLGVPLGIVFQRAVLGYMGQVAAGTRVPESTFAVFVPSAIVGLALTGLAIAAIGAYLPRSGPHGPGSRRCSRPSNRPRSETDVGRRRPRCDRRRHCKCYLIDAAT